MYPWHRIQSDPFKVCQIASRLLRAQSSAVSAVHAEEKPTSLTVAHEALRFLWLLLCVLPASCAGLPAASRSLITSACFPKGLWSLLPLPPDLCSTPILTYGLCSDLPFSMKPALSILFNSVNRSPVLLTLLPTLLFSMALILQHWHKFLPIMFMVKCRSSARL